MHGCDELAEGGADRLCESRRRGFAGAEKVLEGDGVGAAVFHDDETVLGVKVVDLGDGDEGGEGKPGFDAGDGFDFECLGERLGEGRCG